MAPQELNPALRLLLVEDRHYDYYFQCETLGITAAHFVTKGSIEVG